VVSVLQQIKKTLNSTDTLYSSYTCC